LENISDRAPSQAEVGSLYNSRNRNSSLRKKEPIESNENKKYQLNDLFAPNYERGHPTEARAPLNEYAVNINCPSSIRQAKFKNYLENKDVCKKISFEEG
jgi:hypothetical protein